MLFNHTSVLKIAVTSWAIAILGATYLVTSGAYMRF